ncbi:unnamed protein product [Cochlearia groenlandica]
MASPRYPNEGQIQDDEFNRVEFTKEQVLALLRDTTKIGNYNTRGKIERMAHIIKRLKACVEWFQQAEETHVTSLKEDDAYHILQVYNSNLQQYNVILQTDLESVCIFTYGQTGSGKTYTMTGRPEKPEQIGLIPRSLELVFKACQSLVAQGWKYKMQVHI